jgi:hypothetical protein
MSYPSQKRRLRSARGVAAVLAALMAAGAGLAATPSAQAVPTPEGPAGTIRTMAGTTYLSRQGGYGDVNGVEGGPAVKSQFQNPRGLNFAPAGSPNAGDIYITDALNHLVRRIDGAGNVSLVAGTAPAPFAASLAGETGDGGPATSALLREPHGVAVDSKGNVYIADSRNCVIRKVDTSGTITRFAGTGARKQLANDPYNCDNGTNGADPQTTNNPLSVALDQPKQLFMTQEAGKDLLWITDMGNNMLRKVTINNGVAESMTRIAGVRMNKNFSDGDYTTATMRHAEGIWVANDGTVYFTDGGNNLVRKINKQGIVSTIAGDKATAEANALLDGPCADGNLCGNSDGDGGLAINGHLDEPRGITGDNQGNLFIAEEHGSRIRRIKLDAQGNSTTIDTIAGDGTVAEQRGAGGTAFIKGENGPALETNFNHLHDMQVNPADGSLWIADSRNNRVRAMFGVSNATGGNVQTGGNTPPPPPPGPGNPVPVPGKSGYWALGADGKIFPFGDAQQAMFGDASGRIPVGAQAVHMEPTVSGRGYWITDDRGNVYHFGDAAPHGGIASRLLPGEKAASLSRTPSGNGYWIFTSKGRVFTFGDAKHHKDLAAVKLNGDILGSIPTPSGNGYYMVGSDGGVFAFGDAAFYGSMGNVKLNQPVMALVPTRNNDGYWLVASDGGIFAFGKAPFRGSLGAVKLNKPVAGMVRYGIGYMMVGADGGIFNFSDKAFEGSLGGNPPARPITFAATLDS